MHGLRYREERFAAYPDKHSCWDKLVVPRDMLLSELAAWFEAEHKIKLSRWGLKNEPYVFPPKAVVEKKCPSPGACHPWAFP